MDNRISLNVTGFDTEAVIRNLMALESQPLTRLQSQQATLLTKKTAWTAVKSQTDSLTSKISALYSATAFTAKTASVSDAKVLSATALSAAVEGTYEIQVDALATAQVAQTTTFGSTTDAQSLSGTVTLNGKSITINSEDSLETIAAKINATSGVNASATILQTAPGSYRMVLSSSVTGAAGEMSFTGDLATWRSLGVLDLSDNVNEVKPAQDASFTVNGISFTRSSNSVADAIPNVTLNLLSSVDEAGAGGKATLTVSYDNDAIVTKVKDFISEYNKLIDTVGKYNTWNSDTRVAGPLFGDPLATGLLSEMRAVVFSSVIGAPAEYASLSKVGISTGAVGTAYSKDGRLTLDETKLRDALKANRSAVSILFGAEAVNMANSSRGSTVTASSTMDPALYPASSAIDGNTSSALWGSGGGWSDGTAGDFSNDSLEVSFGETRTIDRVTLWTVNSAAMPAASYGVRDFNLEYWNGAAWAALGTPVTGNTSGYRSITFDAVETTKIRLNVTGSNDGQYSRVVELEAFQENGGAFSRLKEVADRYVASDGFLVNRSEALDDEDKALQRSIEEMQKRLDDKEASLRRQYTALEVTLQKLNAQSAWLTQTIQSMSMTQTQG